jgi:hypothetical protein
MAAGVYNTVIEKGATFELTVTYKDATGAAVDLTSWTVRMQVRETPSAGTTILTSQGGSPTITLTKNSSGVISATISATITATVAIAVACTSADAFGRGHRSGVGVDASRYGQQRPCSHRPSQQVRSSVFMV